MCISPLCIHHYRCNALVCDFESDVNTEQSICFIFVMIECDLLNASKIDERKTERKKEREKETEQTKSDI